MPYYRQAGSVPPKRHTQFRTPDGGLLHEELIGTRGFDGPSTLLYHVAPPTAVSTMAAHPPPSVDEWVGDVHRHHRFFTGDLRAPGDYLSARVPHLFNEDVTISIATPDRPSSAFYRNGDCDELVFVHEGSGVARTQFGVIDYAPMDLVHIPRGTIVEWLPGDEPQRLVVIESASEIRPPSRYLSQEGQHLEASPFCERDYRAPRYVEPIADAGSFEVLVKTSRHLTSYRLEHHPFDVVGWDGCYYPYALSIHDFEPIVQRIHTMPNVHQVFATEHAAVCLFVPRVADYHPLAIPAAPNHSSVDCDEMLYLIDGKALGRRGDGPGSMTFHPHGVPHGPKPGMYERSIGVKEHLGHALMVDTFRPLRIAAAAAAYDDPGYPASWVNEHDVAAPGVSS